MTPRRVLRGASTVLILTGSLMVADAGLTLAWQEPVSAVYAHFEQRSLRGDLRELERARPTPVQRRALRTLAGDERRMAFLARALRRSAEPGDAVGRIVIPAIDARFVIVDGTDSASLRKGPGIYDQTPFPGAPGTVGLAGHRTTYGAPFRRLDDLDRGDEITVEMPYGVFTYRVGSTRIVEPSQTEVVDRVDHDRLVLSACHPLYSADQRIIVYARQIEARARGAATGDLPLLPGG